MTGAALDGVEVRRLFEHYFTETIDTIVITDGELGDHGDGPIIQYVNPTVPLLSGRRAEDLIGRPLSVLYTRELFPPILDQLRDTAESGQPTQHDAQTLNRSGRPVWLQTVTLPVISAKGRVEHFIRVGHDITIRKRLEHERETTQRLLASVFGVIDQALAVIDEDGNFSMVNNAVTRQFGWSVFDLIGKPFTEMIESASRKWLVRQLAAREEQEQKCRLPTELLHRNGTVSPGEIVSTIILEPDGRQFRVITFLPKAALAAAVAEASIRGTIDAALKRDGSPAEIVAGKVQLIGLATVRDALGDRWPEVSTGVFTIAERIVQRHLGPGDFCHRTADDGFLVCFAELDEAEAQDKAQIIAEQIRATLTGVAPEMGATRVEGFAARVSLDSSETGSDTAIVAALEARLARERKRLEGGALDTLRRGLADARVLFQRVRTDTNQLAPFSMARLPKPLETALGLLRALDRPDYGLEAEMLLLTGAAERLLSELSENRTDVIIVPVRMSTLVQRRDAERWLPIARSMAAPGRRRLVIEITELGRDTARSRMTDLVMMISSLCRAVAFELPVPETGFVNSLPTTVPLVTIAVQRLANDDGTGHVMAATKLIKSLQLRNCRLLAKNLVSPIQAMSLAKAGVPLLLTQQEA
jgi:PAS domain S-box-containing protein